MQSLLRFFPLLFIIFLASCSPFKENISLGEEKHRPWTHLELGAGNYGEEGHTKKSQRKTVLKDFVYVSRTPNYIDQLPEKDPKSYDPKHQYAVLFWTLDTLVEQKGPKGIFHVNDLYEDYTQYAANHLSQYAQEKGYTDVTIEAITCDYMHLLPLKTLKKYGRTHYDSVHLKNPELPFYNYGMDGDNQLFNDESRKKAREKLQSLADMSKEGLYFFCLETTDNFIPKEEIEEFMEKGIFYLPTTAWEPVPYCFPEGNILDKKFGRVYFIKNQEKN
ncbi:MAG: hypothetical protein H0X26_06760 [Alphaproteobacteria bacterium]|nr:hypothetical protein [Alphaproteobacteria bacterium]